LFFNNRLFYHAFLVPNLTVLKALNVTINIPATRTLFTQPDKDFTFALLPDALKVIELDFVMLIK
jgi:hypothetical protein